MRRYISIGLAALVAVLPAGPAVSVLSASESATLVGLVRGADQQPLSSAKVQIRNVRTGELVASTTSGAGGDFTAGGLEPGTYLVEVVDGLGRLVGTSHPFAMAGGATYSVSVVAGAAAPAVATAGGGFSLLGLGPLATTAVLGAAGAMAVTAVVTTRPDASPSR